MRLRFTPRAKRDLADIADYIHQHNPGAARPVRTAILKSLQDLIVFPELGRRQTVEGVRKLATRKYPYFIYYRLDRPMDEIVILTIRHQARRREFQDL
jgi:toxin ParE1/3/4